MNERPHTPGPPGTPGPPAAPGTSAAPGPPATPGTMPPLDLAVALYDHYESTAEVWHYYGLLAIYGLCRTAELAGDDALLARCRQTLARFPNRVPTHGAYNIQSYRIGGIPRAYMLYRGHMTDDMTRRYVDHYAEEAMLAPRDRLGIMSKPYQPTAELIWIDVAMAVTPYLLFAGLALDRREWVDEAVRQAVLHYDELLNRDNGLLHQCRNFIGPGRYSEDHWGRGNGWGMIALAELVEHLPADSPHRAGVEQRFTDLAGAVLPWQGPRGLWRQELTWESAWEESSGTALLLYCFGIGLRCGLLDEDRFGDAFDRGIAGLRQHCINDDFSTELCCRGCLCPGEGDRKGTIPAYIEDRYPVPDDPHSFGPFMLALTEQHQRLQRSR